MTSKIQGNSFLLNTWWNLQVIV